MQIGYIPDLKLIGCIMSELQPLELQNFPIEAHTNVRIFLLEAPPVEKNSDYICMGFNGKILNFGRP